MQRRVLHRVSKMVWLPRHMVVVLVTLACSLVHWRRKGGAAQRFVQGGIKECSGRVQDRHLWYQCSARPRRNGNCFCRHFESKTNPSCLETHLGERVRSEIGHSIFQGVWDPETLPACECCHSLFGKWSAVSGIYHGVAGKNLGATNGGATHWQRRRPFSLQECGSCSAIFTLGEYRTSWHKAAHFLPRSQQFVGKLSL